MDVTFDNTFKLTAAALYLNLGHPSLPINLHWVAKMLIFYVFYSPTFATLIYSSIFHDRFSKICTNFSLAFLFIIITFNYGLLVVFKRRFSGMIKVVEEDLNSARACRPDDEMMIKKYIAKGVWASKFWLIVCLLSGGMFCIKAVVGTAYSAAVGNFTPVPIHDLTYPTCIEERKNEFYMYVVIFGLQYMYVLFTSSMYVGFNPMGLIFILHACGQIELAMSQLKKLFLEESVDHEKTLKKLKDIACLIQRIYSFVGEIQETHKLLYEMCLKTSTILFPVACFGVIESYNEGNISLELIGFVFGCIMQCAIPCYYCEVLLSKGEDLRVAIYRCGWEKIWMPKSRSIILLMLARAAHPLGIHAVFSTVCLEAFFDVMYQSYRIFNVMNVAWN